jgi:hypothetical protein
MHNRHASIEQRVFLAHKGLLPLGKKTYGDRIRQVLANFDDRHNRRKQSKWVSVNVNGPAQG